MKEEDNDSTLIGQGAEGKVYRITYFEKDAICKSRVSKKYRIAFLDQKINRQRILQESRCLAKCKKFGIRAPT
jgi:TP53 regulating kinase-like protein